MEKQMQPFIWTIAQVKINTVIGYGLWRVMTGQHDSIRFSLMEGGHTKFHPDWHFRLWKVIWRTTTVETLSGFCPQIVIENK
ncbi:hypothetical protein KUTeg_021602 [Tegillarca granosa]|uniref:Uncharacterized protein n=1 Tax=Tegillarca granosa TaxID=220873 RepID=A0ABQ9E3T3_TEGGR|nr:hypothetical protein KUTeg_021602 [Tegillarca granosa]